jgi:hypothetical protein
VESWLRIGEQKLATFGIRFGCRKLLFFDVRTTSLCQRVFNVEMTDGGHFPGNRKHFQEKDLQNAILGIFHSIFRCYYDYEIL